eukprot:gene22152-48531_t
MAFCSAAAEFGLLRLSRSAPPAMRMVPDNDRAACHHGPPAARHPHRRPCVCTATQRRGAGATAGGRRSQFRGVLWDGKRGCWRVECAVGAETITIRGGQFPPDEKGEAGAAKAHDAVLRQHARKVGRAALISRLNFGWRAHQFASPEAARGERIGKLATSRYAGVARRDEMVFSAKGKPRKETEWEAVKHVPGAEGRLRTVVIGRYASELDAALAYDRALRADVTNPRHARTNFPSDPGAAGDLSRAPAGAGADAEMEARIAEHGGRVRELKARGAPEAEVREAVRALLAVKRQRG